ncbi:hypothetical protein [Microbacterium sp. NPDC089696]|uniref:hypothetical protein n=1 Tax=Microbacterium sp. NPDC089696 TaxID=3364199 RepID=UPI0038089361
MGLLLDTGKLFQELTREITPEPIGVAADLDVGTFAELPFVTHSSFAAQDGNGRGLWTVTYTLSLFDGPSTAFELADALYTGVHGWDESPTAGVIPGVGGVESIINEISAFSQIGGEAQIESKATVQLTASWQLAVRKF